LWKSEYERELLEYDTLAKQMNADSQYTVVRIEPVKWKDVGDTTRETNRIAERVRIRRADLPAFAKQNGLRTDELMDVVNLRRREVTGKGGTWRIGGNALFIDHEARAKERQENALEAQREQEGTAKRAEKVRGIPSSYPDAPLIDWKG